MNPSLRTAGYVISGSLREKVDNKKPRFFGAFERRRPDLNRWILVLQTIALPLGYCAMSNIL